MKPEQVLEFIKLSGGSTTGTIAALVSLFIQHNIDDELSIDTINTRRSHLKQFTEFCDGIGVNDICLLNNHFIDQYFVKFREGYDGHKGHSKSTTNTSKRIMKVFLVWVRDYKEIDIRIHPELIKSVKERDKQPKAIDRNLIAQVVKECPDEQDRLIIAVFSETGVRISELVAIKVKDIHGDSIDIQGKGQVDRRVQVTDALSAALRLFIQVNNRQEDDYLFQNTRTAYGAHLTKDTVWRHVKKWFKQIVDIDMHPHQLRHSFAIFLLESGCDIVTIKELLGHEDINTTMVYLRISNNYIRKEYKSHIGKSLIA